MGEKQKPFSGGSWFYNGGLMSFCFWTDGIYAAGANLSVWNFDVLEWKEAERRLMVNMGKVLFVILISAMITFGLRLLPFLIFRNDDDLPDRIKRLGEILPSAIMAILIVYCLKDVGNDFMTDGIWRLTAVLIVVVSYKWKHNTLLSILLGTVSYMLLLHI